jgi:hypothetical protein
LEFVVDEVASPRERAETCVGKQLIRTASPVASNCGPAVLANLDIKRLGTNDFVRNRWQLQTPPAGRVGILPIALQPEANFVGAFSSFGDTPADVEAAWGEPRMQAPSTFTVRGACTQPTLQATPNASVVFSFSRKFSSLASSPHTPRASDYFQIMPYGCPCLPTLSARGIH